MVHNKNLVPKVLVFIFLGILAAAEAEKLQRCEFPVIYNFGDSNSDTTNGLAANDSLAKLCTEKPLRVLSDGRLIVDFIAEKLEKPYLSAYRDNLGKNFSHGANFAVGGSTIQYQNQPVFPFLASQLSQFYQFKGQTNPLLNKASNRTLIPKAKDFPRALYTIDIGQNDVTISTYGANVDVIPYVLYEFAIGVKKLYDEGARAFWIHNTGPVGCLSGLHGSRAPYVSGELDEFGCLKFYNDVAKEFNKQLKNKVVELRAELKEAAITYVDVYPVKYKLFTNAKNLGFANPLGICKNGNVTCEDPSKYLLWDGVHYTEAANRLVAEAILDGSFSDPPLAITQACHRM